MRLNERKFLTRKKICAVIFLLILAPSGAKFALPNLFASVSSLVASPSDAPSIGTVKGTLLLQNNTILSGTPEPSAPGSPINLAYDPLNNEIYTADADPGTMFNSEETAVDWDLVSVINATSGVLIGSINTTIASSSPGAENTLSITVDTNNGYVYAADSGGALAVIDGASNKLIDVIPPPLPSYESSYPFLAYDSTNNYVYVYYGYNGTLYALDPTTNTFKESIQLEPYSYSLEDGIRTLTCCTASSDLGLPSPIAVDPTTNRIYVLNNNNATSSQNSTISATISVIDGSTNSLIESVSAPKGYNLYSISVNPSNDNLYLGDEGISNPDIDNVCQNCVLVMNGTSYSIEAKITMLAAPGNLVVDQVSNEVYVTTYNMSVSIDANNVYAIYATNNSLVSGVMWTDDPGGIIASPTNSNIYVALFTGTNAEVEVGNGTALQISSLIPLDYGPINAAYDPINGNIYVADGTADYLTEINSITNQIIGTVPLSSYNFPTLGQDIIVQVPDIQVNPSTGVVYAGVEIAPPLTNDQIISLYNCSFVAIDPETNSLVADIQIEPGASLCSLTGIAYDAVNNEIYVASFDAGVGSGGQITVINASSYNVITVIQSSGSFSFDEPYGISVDNASGTIYVSELQTSNETDAGYVPYVLLVNASSNQLAGQINFPAVTGASGAGTGSVVFDPSTNFMYVGVFYIGFTDPQGILSKFAIINGAANTLLNTNSVPTGISALDFALNPTNDFIYSIEPLPMATLDGIPYNYTLSLTAMEPLSQTFTGTVSLGLLAPFDFCWDLVNACAGFAVDASSGNIYVTNPFPDTVSIIGLPPPPPKPATTFSVKIEDANGNPISGIPVTFEDSSGLPLGGGASGTNGYTLPVQVPSNLSSIEVSVLVSGFSFYEAPPVQSFPITAYSNNTGSITLRAVPHGYVAGQVQYDNGTIAQNVTVTAVELVNGINFATSVLTNSNGDYNITLYAGTARVQSSSLNTFEVVQTAVISANQTSTLNLILHQLEQGYVSAQLYTKYLGQPSYQGPVSFDWRTAFHFQMAVSDPLGNTYYPGAEVYPVPVQGYAGEQFTVCLDGSEAGLPSGCANATLGTDLNGTASIYLAQQGEINGTVVDVSDGQPVLSWNAEVYSLNGTGFRTSIGYIENQSSILTYSVPQPGDYAIDIQSESLSGEPLFASITVPVGPGEMIQLGNITLSPEGAFAGKSGNQLTMSPDIAVPGSTENVRVLFKNAGTFEATNARIQLDIPTGTSLVQGSLTLNGSSVSNGMSQGSQYVVPLPDLNPGASGEVNYQLQLSGSFNASLLAPEALIVYDDPSSGTNNVTELLGSASVPVYPVTINAEAETNSLSMTVDGQAEPGSTILIFDGNAVVGTANATGNGFWQANIQLSNTGSPSEHILRAQANSSLGILVNSPGTLVNYDKNLPVLNQVCISTPVSASGGSYSSGRSAVIYSPSSGSGSSVCLNPQGMETIPFVVVPGYPLTFSLYFSNSSDVTDVYVYLVGSGLANATLDSDGVYRATLQATDSLGAFYVGYLENFFPQGNGTFGTLPTQQQVESQVPAPLSNASYTLLNQNSTGITVRAVLPNNGGTITASMSITPDVVYTPTQSDIDFAEQAGYPVYDFHYSVTNTSSNFVSATESYFIPYSALPSSLVSAIDSPGEGAGVFVKLGEGFDGVGFANDIASTLNNLALAEEANEKLEAWQNCVEHPQIPFATPEDQQKMLNQIEEFRYDVQEEQVVSLANTIVSHLFSPEEEAVNIFTAPLGAVGDKMLDQVKEDTMDEINHYAGFEGDAAGCFGLVPRWIYDPSGYVYEALPSNRLPGVTATIFYQNPSNGTWVQWKAASYDQQNQEVTDGQGRYGWNVPPGKWMIVYQKPGYQTIDSPILNIPPPVTDLDIGMLSTAPPSVSGAIAVANGSSSYVLVEFSKYVQAQDITSSNFYVTTSGGQSITGTVDPLNPQTDPSGTALTREAVFHSSAPLSVGSEYTVNLAGSIESYANVSMGSNFSQTLTAQTPPTFAVSINGCSTSCENQIALGNGLTVNSQSNDALANAVNFAWYNPQGNLTNSETLNASSGVATSTPFFPTEVGNWSLVTQFTDGSGTIFGSSTEQVSVVSQLGAQISSGGTLPIVPGSVFLSSVSVNATGGFYVDSRSTNGIQITVTGATSPQGTVESVNSFIYSSTPPSTTNVYSQLGTQPLLFVDVRLTPNVGGTATVCVTNGTISSSNWMYYETTNSSSWTSAFNVQFVAPNTLCGEIPVSMLYGTPIVITQSQESMSTSTSVSTTTTQSSSSSASSSSSTSTTSSSSTAVKPSPPSGFLELAAIFSVLILVGGGGVAFLMMRRRKWKAG